MDSEIVEVDSTPAIWGSSHGFEQLFSCHRRFQKTCMWNLRNKYDRSEETITSSDGLNKLALFETQRSGMNQTLPFISELCSVLRHRPPRSRFERFGRFRRLLCWEQKLVNQAFSLSFGMAGLYCYWICNGTYKDISRSLC